MTEKSYGNAFSWHEESKRASHFTSSNAKGIDDFDCDNTFIDADVDGTHNHLFLNSQQCDGEDDVDVADDEGYKIKRRGQKATSARKSY